VRVRAAHHWSDTSASARAERASRRTPEQIERILLDVLDAANAALSAYELSEHAQRAGHRLVPNQVYRTLARLLERGAIRRLETLSKYIVRREEAGAVLICQQCRSIRLMPTPEALARLESHAGQHGFQIRRVVIELEGHCPACARNHSPA